MPTLQSINIHPQLRKKLQEEVDPPILSPLAILSRDPSSQILGEVPLYLWDNIRSTVADALLSSSKSNVIPSEESSSLIVGSFTALEYQRHLKSVCSMHHPLTTNCQTMDQWFQPAEGSPMLIQLTGPHGSGKTQVCLSLAINHIRLEGESSIRGRVYYLLSSNVSPNPIARRLRQISFCRTQDVQQIRAILDRIELTSVNTPHQVLYALGQLMDDQKETNHDEPILLLFDSVSGCLSGCTDWNLIQQISLKLKELVRWHGIQIVLTNGVISNDKAALGQIWTDVAEVVIRMDTTNNGEPNNNNTNNNGQKGIRAILERHPILPPSPTNSVEFLLTAKGIETCQFTTTQQETADPSRT
mmetsp:Transcript_11129/g.16346  ORF Transcript_11129/g.16346 Transcript_11129/m.16346 type:complete len:358 (-) Transcript_11129:441-1514(-)